MSTANRSKNVTAVHARTTHARTHAQTDGHIENITPSAANMTVSGDITSSKQLSVDVD